MEEGAALNQGLALDWRFMLIGKRNLLGFVRPAAGHDGDLRVAPKCKGADGGLALVPSWSESRSGGTGSQEQCSRGRPPSK